MPTYETDRRFWRDWDRLTESEREQFLAERDRFVADLREMEAGKRNRFRRRLRVKGVKGYPGVLEMRWAPDGRATFSWGEEKHPGQRHIIWRRCGNHEILKDP